MKTKKIQQRRKRRANRVRIALENASGRLRVSVFRSLNHIYAQIIDDQAQKTIVSSSSLKIKQEKADKKAIAKSVGLDLAKKALNAKVEQACFDRGAYLYHGRIKSLAEGLREGGLKI
ncbi:MAG: 50S ribosomal protein L18 [Epsilonproteobacteria bacterium]|nr:50S ribosomal protein L18 [Campylobacterota bacterium]|tara:strand:+ start:969 stop:1322 length:354 start_codon:yes stop_codon:yes gene_type:complete